MMNTYSQVLLDPKHQMTFDVEHLETGMNLTIKGCPQAQINSNTEHTEASEPHKPRRTRTSETHRTK